MSIAHNLGFPRIGARRELKRALEAYWSGTLTQHALLRFGRELREQHWRVQAQAGVDLVPVGDFSWYDHVLDMSAMLGVVPPRFGEAGAHVDLDTYFRMARGRAPTGEPAAACEMTKWFDTNYHYLVPEFHRGQTFRLASGKLIDEVREAQALGHRAKPVLLGPLSYLWLGKIRGGEFDKLDLLEGLLPVYGEILARLAAIGVEWAQIDEPILALDLPREWRQAFELAYNRLQGCGVKRLLAVFFGPLADNLTLACQLPVDGLHIDAVRARDELATVVDRLPSYKILSAGIVDGRNVWRTDLDDGLSLLQEARQRLADRLWIAPSCSLLHVPVDLEYETALDAELTSWLAFAKQKLQEIVVLKRALTEGEDIVAEQLASSRAAIASRRASARVQRPDVRARADAIRDDMTVRGRPYALRAVLQRARFKLPLFPATTIGSFPQTAEIRRARREFIAGALQKQDYDACMRAEIKNVVRRQEEWGLDVLVHGEAERNDMVEYFGEQLDGFAVTENGWVQSYGSRCVKPPLIYGDVARPQAMTVEWATYAQSLTDKPMKGMLTGPITMLQWSFVRDDQPRATTCLQIALALRDEVLDLERAGIKIIQVDEPALREGMPLRASERRAYFDWAVRAFRVASSGVADDTQIHTHMCYSEFNDILDAIVALDADVVTIETSRSDAELLDALAGAAFPNEIGPGVYDIHSPNTPGVDDMMVLLRQASVRVPAGRLWVNPDCGLKTRSWDEVEPALRNMVEAARRMRARVRTSASAGDEPR